MPKKEYVIKDLQDTLDELENSVKALKEANRKKQSHTMNNVDITIIGRIVKKAKVIFHGLDEYRRGYEDGYEAGYDSGYYSGYDNASIPNEY